MPHTLVAQPAALRRRPCTSVSWRVALLAAACIAPARAQQIPAPAQPDTQIHVRVLRGHSGRPVAHHTVVLTTQTPAGNPPAPMQAVTDRSGLAAFTVPAAAAIHASVPGLASCSPAAPQGLLPDDAGIPNTSIRLTGVVRQNSCEVRSVSRHPGELVLFVHSAHWWRIFSL